MSLVLAPVQDWADRQPFALDNLAIQFHFEPTFSRAKPALMGDGVYDEYEFKLARVVFLNAQKEPVATLDEAADPLAFQAMVKGMNDLGLRPTSQVVDQGDSPNDPQPATYGWATFAQRVALEDQFFDALINEDEEEIRRLQFERFKLTKTYADQPCDENFFKGLRTEYEQSPHMPSMDFSHYYEWLHRSAKENLGEDGQLSAPCKTALQQMLTAWSSMKDEEVQCNANRNLHVHPRHRALVNAFLTEERSRASDTGAEPAPTDPTPIVRPRTRRLG